MHDEPAGTLPLLRRLLLGMVLLGEIGLLAELALLEHIESLWQWVPIVLLSLALPLTLATALRPSGVVVQALRGLAVLMLAAGVLGVYLHYRGNVEFELEREGALRGWALFVRSMMGATPALAPGALVQLGLAALLALFRHPLLSRSTAGR